MANPENFASSLLPHVNHNPDVLSCLANLSNDEVFTPPSVANAMLDMLPLELFSNPAAKFLDPVCKSGVFLREITKRLMRGLEKVFPDMQERLDHILHNQVYGIAITELTSLLSRRTLYCSKYPNSPLAISHFENVTGNVRFKSIRHVWKNGKCVFCGASQAQYDREEGLETHAYEFIHTDNPQEIFGDMKFDVIIGNPPYQLSDGGGSNGISAKPIYQLFVKQAKNLNPNYLLMIIPARWFAGGKGLNDFREEMKNDSLLNTLVFYPKSRDCFNGVDIAGGVCYFLRTNNKSEKVKFITIKNNEFTILNRKLNEYEIIIGDNIGVKILNKVHNKSKNYIDQGVLSRNSFGFTTSFRGRKNKFENSCRLFSSNGISYVESSAITKNKNIVNNYKIIIGTLNPDRGGVNNSKDGKSNVTTKIKLLYPGDVVTETYIVAGNFRDKKSAKNFMSYLSCKFVRFLILLTISSMHIVKNNFRFVPLQDFSKPWTDAELYAKYNLSQEEIDFIESMIKPMDLSADTDSEPQDA